MRRFIQEGQGESLRTSGSPAPNLENQNLEPGDLVWQSRSLSPTNDLKNWSRAIVMLPVSKNHFH